MHNSDGNIRSIHPSECVKEVLEELEKMGYIITTECENNWLKVKPLGHYRYQASFSDHYYCICKNKKP
jgi:hypothetical protein